MKQERFSAKAFQKSSAMLVAATLGLLLCGCPPPPPPDIDWDNDGVIDSMDNCFNKSNPAQEDADGDGKGDLCDGDIDGDGAFNSSDNCPNTPNSSQADSDDDGTGDACDTDAPKPGEASFQGGAIHSPEATILTHGNEYADSAPAGEDSLVAVVKDGHAFFYHTAQGQVELSDENSAYAIGYFIAGGVKDASEKRRGATQDASPFETETGLIVTANAATSTYHFENPKKRWAAVRSTSPNEALQAPVFLRPRGSLLDINVTGALLEGEDLIRIAPATDASLTVDASPVRTYGSLARAIPLFLAPGSNIAVGADLLPKAAEALDHDPQLFMLLNALDAMDVIFGLIGTVAGLSGDEMIECQDVAVTFFLDNAALLEGVLAGDEDLMVDLAEEIVNDLAVEIMDCIAEEVASDIVGIALDKLFYILKFEWAFDNLILGNWDVLSLEAYDEIPGLETSAGGDDGGDACGVGEPNGTKSQATEIVTDSPQTHCIRPAGDQDWFTFELDVARNVSIQTTGTRGDTFLQLYDSNSTEIASDDDGGGDLFSMIEISDLAAGRYYFRVTEFGDNAEIENYTVALFVTSHDQCADGDADADGICDAVDNCPEVANSSQSDSNADGIGDACDDGGGSDEITVRVSATDPDWQTTGIRVTRGEAVTFSATGTIVHWKSGDGSQEETCGPDGIEGTTNEDVYLAPGLRKMALVGSIADYTFNVGSTATYTAQTDGTVMLGINDTNYAGGCADNEGYWTVRITKL